MDVTVGMLSNILVFGVVLTGFCLKGVIGEWCMICIMEEV